MFDGKIFNPHDVWFVAERNVFEIMKIVHAKGTDTQQREISVELSPEPLDKRQCG